MVWAPAYATTGELKSYLRIGDAADDPELGSAVEAASRAVDWATHRQFGRIDTDAAPAPEARTYEVEWDRGDALWVADIDDLMTITGLVVTVAGEALASSSYELYPLNAAQKARPWETLRLEDSTDAPLGSGPRTVEVTASWGWLDVPVAVKTATLMQAAKTFKMREAPFGVTGSPELGTEIRLEDKADPTAKLLRPYRLARAARMFA